MCLNKFRNLVPSVDGILAFFNSGNEDLIYTLAFFWMIISLKLSINIFTLHCCSFNSLFSKIK